MYLNPYVSLIDGAVWEGYETLGRQSFVGGNNSAGAGFEGL